MASAEFLDKVGSVNHAFSLPWLALTSSVGRDSGGGFGNYRGSGAIDIGVALSCNVSACHQVAALRRLAPHLRTAYLFELETAALRALSIVSNGVNAWHGCEGLAKT
jgi:hypothetical protein